MALAMFGFTTNDAITKGLTDTFSLAQIIAVRGLFATMLMACLAWYRGAFAQPALALNPLVVARAFTEVGATLLFLTALAHMPLANISAVLQSLPLAVTMGAALFFGERVRWRRWLAITIGFAGVLVIVRPGLEGFNAYSLLVLCCVCFAAARDLITRQIPDAVPSLLVSVVTAGLLTVVGSALIIPLGGWAPMQPLDLGKLALAAVLLMIGYQFIIVAMRMGDISFVAPFRYTALLWAVTLGILMFGEWPDEAILAGAALVVGSGLYSLYRERKLGRAKPIAETSAESITPDGL